MVPTMEWPKARLPLVLGILLTATGVWGAVLSTRHAHYVDALLRLVLAGIGGALLVRELRTRRIPGAKLDSSRLETLAWGSEKPSITPLDEIVGIDWESLGYLALRLRSGEVRTINSRLIRRRDRKAFIAALKQAVQGAH